jgi:hypothetical protein
MKLLTKDQILKATDLPVERINVEEWNGSVIVRTISAAERDEFEQNMSEQRGKRREVNLTNIRAKLCALCMVDEAGQRLFTDAEVAALGQKSGKALDKVFGVAQRINGFTRQDVEELAKNSETAPSDASPSD